jgi:Domain of unknown function (DUF4126)
MEILAWAFSTGWASGISGYSVVLILGLAGRLFGASGVPPGLERTDVLVAAAVLFVVDLVADKIPYVDSIWDAVHTVVRPAIGATVAALIAGQSGSLSQIAAATTGGLTALASHAVKAGLRAAINTSPEPASNVAVSTAEDVTVAGVVSLSVLHPVAAAVIAGVLLVTGIALVMLLLGRIRRFRARWRERRLARSAPGASTL